MGLIIRVELNGAPSAAVYENLHDSMLDAGIGRSVVDDDGSWFELPNATYYAYSDAGPAAVRDIVVAIANRVWKGGCDVIVVKDGGAAWQLRPINTAPPAPLGGLAALFGTRPR